MSDDPLWKGAVAILLLIAGGATAVMVVIELWRVL